MNKYMKFSEGIFVLKEWVEKYTKKEIFLYTHLSISRYYLNMREDQPKIKVEELLPHVNLIVVNCEHWFFVEEDAKLFENDGISTNFTGSTYWEREHVWLNIPGTYQHDSEIDEDWVGYFEKTRFDGYWKLKPGVIIPEYWKIVHSWNQINVMTSAPIAQFYLSACFGVSDGRTFKLTVGAVTAFLWWSGSEFWFLEEVDYRKLVASENENIIFSFIGNMYFEYHNRLTGKYVRKHIYDCTICEELDEPELVEAELMEKELPALVKIYHETEELKKYVELYEPEPREE